MRRHWLCLALASGLAVGCNRPSMYGMRPIFHPGPAEYQRNDDAFWDPFPKNDMQDVSMNDIRPRDFDRPRADVKRAQTQPHDAGARDTREFVPVRDAAD